MTTPGLESYNEVLQALKEVAATTGEIDEKYVYIGPPESPPQVAASAFCYHRDSSIVQAQLQGFELAVTFQVDIFRQYSGQDRERGELIMIWYEPLAGIRKPPGVRRENAGIYRRFSPPASLDQPWRGFFLYRSMRHPTLYCIPLFA